MKCARLLGLALLCAAALVTTAGRARAQVEAGTWETIPTGGVYLYGAASGFDDAAFFGGDVYYFLNEYLGIGLTLSFARPVMDGSVFDRVQFSFLADTSALYRVGQQVTQATYAPVVVAAVEAGGFDIRGYGGVGGTTFYLDPEINAGNKSETIMSWFLGGGVGYRFTERSGVRVEVRDEVFTGFERDKFFPAENRTGYRNEGRRFVNDRIPEANGSPPEPDETIHNIRLSIGFIFMPSL
jgi:hypothetical protein